MKRLIFLFLLIPAVAMAQQPPGYDPNQMQEMMKRFQDPAAMAKMQQQAEAAQKCMKGIDESKLEALKTRAEAAGNEIKKLCTAGKKAEALSKGMKFSQELNSDPTVKKLRECSQHMTDMMKGMPGFDMSGLEDLQSKKTPTDDDICS